MDFRSSNMILILGQEEVACEVRSLERQLEVSKERLVSEGFS
jgi:hypothetical protein